MIEINLIPPALRKKKGKGLFPTDFHIPLEIIIGAGGGLIVLLLLAHIFLSSINLVKVNKYNGLKKEMDILKPAKQEVDLILTQLREAQGQLQAIQGVTGDKQLLWAQKLNLISEHLPRGVWLKNVVLDGKALLIAGSAISKEKKEMTGVHALASALKSDPEFMKGMEELELSSLDRKKIQTTEVVDFLITVRVK
ncbi:MAG: PilN domain-containing protein [Candidatus Omnitrophota bacterium]|nr:PilN domain-containing protein [Candidatus Omnitrophota bacterium]